MGNANSQDNSSASAMPDVSNDAEERKEQPTSSAAAAASLPLVLSAEDARAARVARRSQIREQGERDASGQERRRLESLAAKAAAREARRAAALAAQAAQWRSFGPAQRLFTDGVASCLGFLSMKDFISSARVCKQWRVGARAVKSLGRSDLIAPASVLPPLLSWPYRHLVTSFTDSDMVANDDSPQCEGDSFLGPAHLQGLHTLSRLTRLGLRLDLEQFDDATPIQYPKQLTTLRLDLGRAVQLEDDDTWDAAPILQGLASCASLTRLVLELDDDPIVLTALSSLKHLRHLFINGFVELHYTPATLHAIKTFAQLVSLTLKRPPDNVLDFELDWLAPLLTAPHHLQRLHTLDIGQLCLWDNDVCMELLPSLSALTNLNSPYTSVLALPVLASFTQLQDLHIAFDGSLDLDAHDDNDELRDAYDDHGRAQLSALVPHLTHCSLTDLSLIGIACDDESLSALCKSQPLIKVLLLLDAAPTSLRPLATLPHLTQLAFDMAAHSDPLPRLFEQICACKSLRQLVLRQVVPALSEAQQQQLAPPSALLPLLTSFHHTSREEADLEREDSSDSSSSGYASDSTESSSESS